MFLPAPRLFAILRIAPLLAPLFLSGCFLCNRELRTQNTILNARVEALQQDFQVERERYAETSSALEIARIELRNAGSEMPRLERELAAAKAQLADARATLQTVQNNREQVSADASRERLEREASLTAEIELLRARVAERETSFGIVNSDLADARRERDAARAAQARAEELARKYELPAKNFEAIQTSYTLALAQIETDRTRYDAYVAEQETLKAELRSAAAAAQQRATETEARLTAPAIPADRMAALRDAVAQQVGTAGTVRQEKNRLVVELPSDAMFQPATVQLSDGGLRTLERLRGVLATSGATMLRVTGHTDNVPIGRMPYPDNWELAAARACEVVRWLAVQEGIAPERLRAESRAYFEPLKPHDTPAGRAANRRVEIALEFAPPA